MFRLQEWPIGGGAARTIADLPFQDENEVGRIAASPDGNNVIVGRTSGPALLVSYKKREIRELPSVRGAYAADWFPDSRHVAYIGSRGRQLVIASTQTASHRLVLSGTQRLGTNLAVSPDGTQIAFGRGSDRWDILEFGANGKYVGPLRAIDANQMSVDWSPLGDAFVHVEEDSGVWIRKPDGTGPRRLVNDRDAIEPDERRIAQFADDVQLP
jgi:hypothetical protein